MLRAALPLLVVGWILPSAAGERGGLPLETVLPTLPGKNNVRWWEFDWKWTEFTPVANGAPIRLFFYEQERGVAQVAEPFIARAYEELVPEFDYVPRHTVPFLLYNSHFEFESTRAFLVSEQVLGVTSPQDLTMALPYWGEHRRFQEVMRHELAHQFTIQKLLDLEERGACNPLTRLPLWFIEGIAQHVALEGLTADVRAHLADLAVTGRRRLPEFFDPGPFTFERVYLLGHAQVAFLEEEFGEGTMRRLLDEASRLCLAEVGFFAFRSPEADFPDYVTDVLGVERDSLDRRFREWVEEVVAPSRAARHPFPQVGMLRRPRVGEPDSVAISPGGDVLFIRTIDLDSGIARLFLRDLTAPRSEVQVTQDQRVGLQSLHPFDRRSMAVGAELIVYIGRKGASDVLFVRPYRRERDGGRVRFVLGGAVEHELSEHHGLLEGGFPAISPTGAVAFIGLSRETGFLDIYRVDDPLDPDAPFLRVTDDPYAEEGLAFGPDGALYYGSDATPDGENQLFRQRGDQLERVTRLPRTSDLGEPSVDASGAVTFEAAAAGRFQAYRYQDGSVVQLTDLPTYLRSPVVAADGSVIGIALNDRRRRLVRIRSERLLETPLEPALAEAPEGRGGAGLAPWRIPTATFEEVVEYRPLANLRLVGAAGGASLGPLVLAEVVFADRFNTHIVGASTELLGDFGRFNGAVFYLNQSGRLGVGGAAFVLTGLQLEEDPLVEERTFFLQRYGVRLDLVYPFGRFSRIEGFVAPQALRGFDFASPTGPFAQEFAGVFPGVQVGGRYAIDTLRFAPFGPVDGVALSLGADGTYTFGRADPFAAIRTELRGFKTLIPGLERVFVQGRLAFGTSFGGAFREEFFLPAAANLRAVPEGTLQLLGNHYYLGQVELQFPLAPELSGIFLQGVAAFDAGGVFFDWATALDRRRAAAVLGGNVALGPVTLRLHFARPVDLGGEVYPQEWITHLSVTTPFLFQ